MTKIKKTFSLDPDVVKIIKSKCNGNQTKYVQDCIKNASCGLDCSECDDEVKKTHEMIIKNIHNSKQYTLEDDDFGRPVRLEMDWWYDEEET